MQLKCSYISLPGQGFLPGALVSTGGGGGGGGAGVAAGGAL